DDTSRSITTQVDLAFGMRSLGAKSRGVACASGRTAPNSWTWDSSTHNFCHADSHRCRRAPRHPSELRRQAGLRPGMPPDVRVHDGRIEIEPAATPIKLEQQDRLLVAATLTSAPPARAVTTRLQVVGRCPDGAS